MVFAGEVRRYVVFVGYLRTCACSLPRLSALYHASPLSTTPLHFEAIVLASLLTHALALAACPTSAWPRAAHIQQTQGRS